MPGQSSRSLLDSSEAATRLATLAGWRIDGSELVKAYKFENFVQAVDFVNAITRVAEVQNHHPYLLVRWGEVTVRVTTHSAGGLTAKDFEFAAAIDVPR